MTRTPKPRARTWEELTRSEQDRAIVLIRSEMLMWLSGHGTNWEHADLSRVRLNYRVLRLAIAHLTARRTKRKGARQ